MHADRGHIRPRLHAADGQAVSEIKVSAMRLVAQHLHAVGVRAADDLPQIGAYAVIGRVVDKHRLGAGVGRDGACHIAHRHAQRDAQPLARLGVDVDRDTAANDQRVDHALVHVARQDELITFPDGGEDHRLDGSGGAAYHKESRRGAEGLSGQLFALHQYAGGMAEAVEVFGGIDIHRQAAFAQKVHQFFVAPSALMPGDIKWYQLLAAHLLQRFPDGGSVLVQHC